MNFVKLFKQLFEFGAQPLRRKPAFVTHDNEASLCVNSLFWYIQGKYLIINYFRPFQSFCMNNHDQKYLYNSPNYVPVKTRQACQSR